MQRLNVVRPRVVNVLSVEPRPARVISGLLDVALFQTFIDQGGSDTSYSNGLPHRS